jgi:hypothetical protein
MFYSHLQQESVAEFVSVRHRYRVKAWLRQALNKIYLTHIYDRFKGLQELNIKMITSRVGNASH